MNYVRGVVIALCAACAVLPAPVYAASHKDGPRDLIEHGRNPKLPGAVTKGSTGVVTPKITYHNGALISTPNIYYIWYGNWNQTNGSDNPAGQQILRDFAMGIGGSPHYQLNTTYSVTGKTITGSVGFGGETTDAYSKTASLKDADIFAVVNNAINANKLPYDANGVYFVLSSTDVRVTSGFCTRYCGWHTSGVGTKGRIRYSFVGNANRCLSGCAAQTTSPNGNAGVDAMASIIAHELEEAATDPDPASGWVDANGAENADKCAWTFGQNLMTAANGSTYNMTLGTRNFLIQRNLKQASTGDTCNVDMTNQ